MMVLASSLVQKIQEWSYQMVQRRDDRVLRGLDLLDVADFEGDAAGQAAADQALL